MVQFYILEIKKYPNGEYEHDLKWAFDDDATKAQKKAESIALDLLSKAAVSQTVKHSVSVISDECFQGLHKCYENLKPTAE